MKIDLWNNVPSNLLEIEILGKLAPKKINDFTVIRIKVLILSVLWFYMPLNFYKIDNQGSVLWVLWFYILHVSVLWVLWFYMPLNLYEIDNPGKLAPAIVTYLTVIGMCQYFQCFDFYRLSSLLSCATVALDVLSQPTFLSCPKRWSVSLNVPKSPKLRPPPATVSIGMAAVLGGKVILQLMGAVLNGAICLPLRRCHRTALWSHVSIVVLWEIRVINDFSSYRVD